VNRSEEENKSRPVGEERTMRANTGYRRGKDRETTTTEDGKGKERNEPGDSGEWREIEVLKKGSLNQFLG